MHLCRQDILADDPPRSNSVTFLSLVLVLNVYGAKIISWQIFLVLNQTQSMIKKVKFKILITSITRL